VCSNVRTAFSKNDWQLDLVHGLPSQSVQGDPSIDDPVKIPDSACGAAICDFRGSLLVS
jgi:hypothetical protein